jgi:hypothetical protein
MCRKWRQNLNVLSVDCDERGTRWVEVRLGLDLGLFERAAEVEIELRTFREGGLKPQMVGDGWNVEVKLAIEGDVGREMAVEVELGSICGRGSDWWSGRRRRRSGGCSMSS